jgi:hypothetical protein
MVSDVSAPQKNFEEAFLLAQHVPRIARWLLAIYEAESDIDRFLAIEIEGSPQSYVQAIFVDEEPPFLLLEAASGFYAQADGMPRVFEVSAAGKAKLEKLGFLLDDSDGNFQLKLYYDPDSALADFHGAASVIIRALITAYGLSMDSAITLEAPFAPDGWEDFGE